MIEEVARTYRVDLTDFTTAAASKGERYHRQIEEFEQSIDVFFGGSVQDVHMSIDAGWYVTLYNQTEDGKRNYEEGEREKLLAEAAARGRRKR